MILIHAFFPEGHDGGGIHRKNSSLGVTVANPYCKCSQPWSRGHVHNTKKFHMAEDAYPSELE